MVLEIGRELEGGGKIISLVPDGYRTTHVIVEYPNGTLEKLDVESAVALVNKSPLEKEFEVIGAKAREAINAITDAKALIEKRGMTTYAWAPLEVEDYSWFRDLSGLVDETFFWMTSQHRCGEQP